MSTTSPCLSRASYSWLPRNMFRWLLSISKDGDSTTCLGNLCQCSVTRTVKKCFPMLRGNLLCFSVCPLPLVLSVGTTEKTLAPSSLHSPFRCVYMHLYMYKPLSAKVLSSWLGPILCHACSFSSPGAGLCASLGELHNVEVTPFLQPVIVCGISIIALEVDSACEKISSQGNICL